MTISCAEHPHGPLDAVKASLREASLRILHHLPSPWRATPSNPAVWGTRMGQLSVAEQARRLILATAHRPNLPKCLGRVNHFKGLVATDLYSSLAGQNSNFFRKIM